MTNIKENSFGKRALLVKFTQHKWSASKKDASVTNEINRQKGVSQDSGYYIKKLIDDKAFEKLGQLVGEAYRYHNTLTVPYMYRGTGMLPITLHSEYTKKMREYKEALAQAKREMREILPSVVERMRENLGQLFRIEDYPMDKIADYFDFDVAFFPVPDSGHFIVDVQNEAMDEIKSAFADAERDAIKEVTSELWERLFKVVKNMEERLSVRMKDPKARFHDTLVSNITELCGLLPALNLAGDPNLDNMVKSIENRLTVHEPEKLRTDKRACKEVANNAKEILASMEAFMS